MIRALWLSLGMVALGAGLIGIVLPLVPTVPFLLLAAFCFARSSERMHHWLLNHRYFGPPITNWQERRAISRPAKGLATLSILSTLVVPVTMGFAPVFIVLQCVALAGILGFLWTRRET